MGQMPAVTFGSIEIVALVGGRLRLDGGAMFGVVPKPVWQRTAPADDRNRIAMASTPLLVRTASRTILFDCGLGDKYDAAFRDRYAIEPVPVPDLLGDLGLRADDIDTVVCSHLHWDHAGGATWRNRAGDVVPLYPRADYLVQQQEWHAAAHPTERNRASYIGDDFLPLLHHGRLVLADAPIAIAPGVRTVHLGGHTIGLQGLLVANAGGGLLALNDLVPTAAHLPYPFVMGYDLYPLDTLARRQALLPAAIAAGWHVAFVHDPGITFADLALDDAGRPKVARVLG